MCYVLLRKQINIIINDDDDEFSQSVSELRTLFANLGKILNFTTKPFFNVTVCILHNIRSLKTTRCKYYTGGGLAGSHHLSGSDQTIINYPDKLNKEVISKFYNHLIKDFILFADRMCQCSNLFKSWEETKKKWQLKAVTKFSL